ncbi:hypothetical protein [Trueperella pyogenes]|uniref:hypothetical protein n=1 Tax=Trueperella pyogenes TaxID=1661 RepID=UPI00345DE807
MHLTKDQIAFLDNSRNAHHAVSKLGTVAEQATGVACNAHFAAIAYIKAKRGPRAVGGFFDPTRANVAGKFAAVWKEENNK